ncbi:hypothetical protein, partial [Paenibacillus dendritiformis]
DEENGPSLPLYKKQGFSNSLKNARFLPQPRAPEKKSCKNTSFSPKYLYNYIKAVYFLYFYSNFSLYLHLSNKIL